MRVKDGLKIGVVIGLILLMSNPQLSAEMDSRMAGRILTAGLDESFVIDQMQSAIQAYVAAGLAREKEDINVTALSPILSKVVSPYDRVTIRPRPEGVDQRGLVGRAVFLMSVEKENGSESQHWVTADVSVVRKVLVANRLIPRKAVLTPDDLLLKTIHQTQLTQEYVDTEIDLIGKRAARVILPGEPITISRIEDAPVIRRGQRVTFVVESQGIRITGSGRAKKDGFLGQPLDVITQNSNKIISGTVMSGSEVLVAF